MSRRVALTLAVLAIAAIALASVVEDGWALFQGQNPNVNYSLPNYANSPILRKFVDGLPLPGPSGANGLGQYIPIATPNLAGGPTFPGDDYYEIALVEYSEQMHRDLIRLLDETQDKKLLLDFTQVQFMSSAALGMLIRVHKKCRERGIALKLCSIAPQMDCVFWRTSSPTAI